MPANFNLFSTAVMLKAVEQMPRIYTFLSDTFAQDGENCEDENAMYDYRRGNETGLAPFVVPGTGGVAINREGYEMRQIKFSTLAPERVLTLEDVSTRQFGEAVLGAKTPEQRSKEVVARDLKQLRAMVQNSRNWMVREVLLNGKLEIHYDMEKAVDIGYDGLGDVDIMVMGAGVFEAMMANSDFCKTLDMDRVYMDEIRTKYQGQGVRYRGTNSDGVKMISYNGHFLDFDRKQKAHIPAGWILMGSSSNKPLKVMHGPISEFIGQDETASLKTYIKKEVPFRKGGASTDSITTRLVSRPSVVPDNVGAWCIMKVL